MKFKFGILFLLLSISVKAQFTVKGRVVDENNEPLPFINAIIKGTTNGTTTDDEGYFSFVCKQNKGVLEVSYMGFDSQTFQVDPSTKSLNIVLKEGGDILDEVLIVSRPKKRLKKKENPAYKILKEFWKRKRKMGTDLVDVYQYRKHKTVEIGLNNLDTTIIKTMFKEQYAETMKEINYDSDGVNYYIPIHIIERVARVYGNNKLKKVREDIEAEKKEGFNAYGFVFDRMASTFANINIFKNNITLVSKSFVSPFATDGFATYDYLLYDSIVKNNKKSYNIYFFPRRKGDLAFQGNFWIQDKNYAVQKVKMKITKDANLNFVRALTFEKEFDVKKDSIYLPKKQIYDADFTFSEKKNDKGKGLSVREIEKYDNYKFDIKHSNDFYNIKQVKIHPDQYKKSEDYWQGKDDKATISTYKLINSVKGKRKVKKLTGTLNVLVSGYVPIPKTHLQIGHIWSLFGYNEVEGFKPKLSFQTFKTKNDRFRLKGSIAYGFKDEKFKYGIEGQYLLSYSPRIKIAARYSKDIEQLGAVLMNYSQFLGESIGGSTLFSRGNNYYLSNVERFTANIDYAVHPNFHFGFNLSRASINSAISEKFKIDYIDSERLKHNVVDTYTDTYVSYTPKRYVYGLGVEQAFGTDPYPTLVLNFRHGYKGVFGGTHDYSKLQFLYNQPIMLGALGVLDATVEAGKTFDKVPLSLLNPIPANQSYFLSRNRFTLMNYYDFVTDTYAATHLEHHFNGFILNRIPLLKELKLRSLVTFRGAVGDISDKNRQINRSSVVYNSPKNKPYYEYGFGFENIGYGNYRFLRVDAVWRGDYTPAPNSISKPSPKFAIRIGINVNM